MYVRNHRALDFWSSEEYHQQVNMIAIVIAAVPIVLVLFLLEIVVRNHKAHKFFATKTPQLPVVPKPNFNFLAGHALSIVAPGKNWKIIEELHEKYGPTYGYYMIDQPWVSTKDLDLIKLIGLDEAHKHLDRRFLGIPFTQFNDSILQVNGHEWHQQRRSMAPALSNLRVKSEDVTLDVESIVDKVAGSLERKLIKAQEAHGVNCFTVDTHELFKRYTLATFFKTFYKMPDCVDFDADKDVWLDRVMSMSSTVANPVTYLGMGFPILRNTFEWIQQITAVGRGQKEIQDFVMSNLDLKSHQKRRRLVAEERSSARTKPMSEGQPAERGLVDTILDNFFDRKVEPRKIASNFFMILLAGFLTTADTLACLLWQLARNQEVQEKLRQAILERDVDDDYVDWCIYETIRYHPSVPLATGRVLSTDVNVNGLFLPKGTFVTPTIRGIHHDPKIWPEPERFNPERWRDKANFHPAQFSGLGHGPRNCPGNRLAFHEIKLVLRMLLKNYKFETCPETNEVWDFTCPGLFWCLYDEPSMLKFTAIRESAL